jgi:hypothetical protein
MNAKARIPDDWDLSPEGIEFARTRLPGVNVDVMRDQFKAWHQARGTEYLRWDAVWRTWVLHAMPDSGSFAAGRYPRQTEVRPGSVWK